MKIPILWAENLKQILQPDNFNFLIIIIPDSV